MLYRYFKQFSSIHTYQMITLISEGLLLVTVLQWRESLPIRNRLTLVAFRSILLLLSIFRYGFQYTNEVLEDVTSLTLKQAEKAVDFFHYIRTIFFCSVSFCLAILDSFVSWWRQSPAMQTQQQSIWRNHETPVTGECPWGNLTVWVDSKLPKCSTELLLLFII